MNSRKIMALVLALLLLGSSTVLASNDLSDSKVTIDEKKDFNSRFIKYKSEVVSEKVQSLVINKILMGTDKGLELETGLTRAQGAAIYERLFGLEHNVVDFEYRNKDYTTGFDDIPGWAKKTLNYLHSNGIVAGISTTKFGSNDPMSAEQFTTLVFERFRL